MKPNFYLKTIFLFIFILLPILLVDFATPAAADIYPTSPKYDIQSVVFYGFRSESDFI